VQKLTLNRGESNENLVQKERSSSAPALIKLSISFSQRGVLVFLPSPNKLKALRLHFDLYIAKKRPQLLRGICPGDTRNNVVNDTGYEVLSTLLVYP